MAEQESGDPGRTPGSAEGDRETVEQDLQEKQGGQQNEKSETTQKSDKKDAK